MGLDMFLERVAVPDGLTLDDVQLIDDYIHYVRLYRGKIPFSQATGIKIDHNQTLKVASNMADYFEKGYYCNDCGIFEEVGYWRKANHIHNWFVTHIQNNVDDCGRYAVTKDELEELLTLCEVVKKSAVLAHNFIRNEDVIAELLPTKSGFFFGSTDYDKYYMDQVDHTIEVIEHVLESTDFDTQIITYSSSW